MYALDVRLAETSSDFIVPLVEKKCWENELQVHVCLICMPYICMRHALYVCLICMPYRQTFHIFACAMPYMYALYVCLICMPYRQTFHSATWEKCAGGWGICMPRRGLQKWVQVRVCLMRMSYMCALCVCLICMPHRELWLYKNELKGLDSEVFSALAPGT